MRVLFLLILTTRIFPLFAQKEANVWHFGSGCVLDFTTGVPIPSTGSAMKTFEGSASVCDSAGNLLFYTNGGGREPLFSGQDPGHIWNREDQVMYDMKGTEGGGFSAWQSSVIFRAPGQKDLYHVFTMDELEYAIGSSAVTNALQPLGRGLSHFTVNMALNGGLGGVVLADQRVFTPSYEGLCAIRHANGEDYWVLIHQDTLGVGVYSVTSSGIAPSSVFLTPKSEIHQAIKGSPDGTRVQVGSTTLTFDPSTGTLSNPVSWPDDINAYEFSPNSTYLYRIAQKTGFTYTVDRYSVDNPGVEETLFSSPAFESPGQIQLAPDGNIYFLSASLGLDSVWVNRITCPNTSASAVEHKVFAYPISDPTNNFIGLPNFPAWIFRNEDSLFVSLGPDTLCFQGAPITIDAQNPGATYLWSTGATTRTITVSQPGLYAVTVTGSCGSGTDTLRVVECQQTVPTCEVFEYTGSVQQWTVPGGVDTIRVKMWGAAGGGGSDTINSAGGGGGYTEATLAVAPGQVLDIYVGGGGQAATGNTGGNGGWPNGGQGGSGNRVEIGISTGGAGGGGGRSEIRVGGTSYLIAGGGGGGSSNRSGGGGGGTEAEFTASSNTFSFHGFGGTQSAGGAPSANAFCAHPVSGTAGASLQGGTGATDLGGSLNDRTGGGGGGDGYFGGGGGGSHDGCFGVGSSGGGGSGFVCTTCPGLSGNTLTAGFFGAPALAGDPLLGDYPGIATGAPNTPGGHGLVQICYDTPDCITTTTELTASACGSYTAPWGTVYTQSGVYTDTLANIAGCDSIVTVDLKVSLPSRTDLEVTLCEGDTYPFGGFQLTAPGTYVDTLADQSGCDSILVLQLSKAVPFLQEETASACDSFLWDISGQTYLQGGIYEFVLTDQQGCDSTYRLSLDLEGSVRQEETVTAVDTYTWPVNGNTYTSSGVYAERFTAFSGCDSLRILNLTIEVRADLYFPTAFSPDGDGINDRFNVFGPLDVSRVERLRIYDRWGGLIAELTDIPPGSFGDGWDGRGRNGDPLDPGVFVYTTRLLLSDGRTIERSGEVILVR